MMLRRDQVIRLDGDAPPVREIDTTQLGPIRLDRTELRRKEERAGEFLDRHSPEDLHAATRLERRRWTVEAMLAFANEEVRRDREIRRA